MNKSTDDQYSEKETEQRRDDAIRRALRTPPKPQKELVGQGKRAKAGEESRVKKTPK
jgi:hypothetical protein